MLNIEFNTDEDIMARMMVSKSEMPVDFANYLWDKYKLSYIFLQRNFKSNEIDNNIILELKQQSFFKNYCNEAEKNLKRIKTNWEKHKNKINTFLNKIFKKEFTLNISAIIFAPTLCCGRNIGNNQFVWGHKYGLTDRNYDLVYLVHESLHSYFENNNITHTIIEKVSDFELSKKLNKSKNIYNGHEDLKLLHIKILPFWHIYLNKTQENIENDKKFYNVNYEQKDFVEFQPKIENMNIDDFIKFIEQINFEDLLNVECSYLIKKINNVRFDNLTLRQVKPKSKLI